MTSISADMATETADNTVRHNFHVKREYVYVVSLHFIICVVIDALG